MNSRSRIVTVVLCVFLIVNITGCASVKVVRIPIPVPTFGLGGSKVAKSTPTPAITESKYQSFDDYISKQSSRDSGPHIAYGLASWYGKEFHKKRTASGERYNMYALTAAHPSLPFGSQVRVTNVENGRSCVVRINDRGPFGNNRVIDVSLAAARELDFENKGITQVKLEAI